MAEVAIIIVNWNGRDILEKCLRSLEKTGYPNFKIIVVDNGSTDSSVDFVRRNWQKADLVELKRNYGYAKANNMGIKFALKKYNPDFFLLLNNDTEIVRDDWLEKMVNAASSEKETGILGCRLIFPNGKTQYLGSKIVFSGFPGITLLKKTVPKNAFDVDAVIGAVFLVKREVVEKIGLLDEGFSPFLGEDMDYCTRARVIGFKVKVISAVSIIHYVSQSMNRKDTDFLWFVSKKNNLRFVFLHFGVLKILAYVVYDFIFRLPYQIIGKTDANGRLSPMNVRIKRNFAKRVFLFFKAYFENLKSMREILKTRRREKLWF